MRVQSQRPSKTISTLDDVGLYEWLQVTFKDHLHNLNFLASGQHWLLISQTDRFIGPNIYIHFCNGLIKSLKGTQMGPLLVLVCPCIRENEIVTCKIVSFLCS